MDQNLSLITQGLATNQYRFDPQAFDRAVLRAERRRAHLRATVWRLSAMTRAVGDFLHAVVRIATAARIR